MDPRRAISPAYRAVAAAAVISAAIHGAAIVGWQPFAPAPDIPDEPVLTATLVAPPPPGPEVALAPAPPPKPKARAKPKPKPPPKPAPEVRPDETVVLAPEAAEPPTAENEMAAAAREAETAPPPAAGEGPPPAAEEPEVLAMARPAAVEEPPAARVLRPEALPEEINIRYELTSVFADGIADYQWRRQGNRYEISGELQATGFFTVFLQGHILQQSHGTIADEGLRPEAFTERLGEAGEEGLTFDWAAGTVQFRYGDNRRTAPLAGNTVDWLSMIFQLAQRPPEGEAMDLRVYTQRRMYAFHLKVVGNERLNLPFGSANTIHLRHTGDDPDSTVDVWLGIDHHFLPVKLRYPVARNRLVVEQTATAIEAR